MYSNWFAKDRVDCENRVEISVDAQPKMLFSLFPANVPTREHDFFLISSLFHVKNDASLRVFRLKQIPLSNIHSLKGNLDFSVFGKFLLTQFQRRQPS